MRDAFTATDIIRQHYGEHAFLRDADLAEASLGLLHSVFHIDTVDDTEGVNLFTSQVPTASPASKRRVDIDKERNHRGTPSPGLAPTGVPVPAAAQPAAAAQPVLDEFSSPEPVVVAHKNRRKLRKGGHKMSSHDLTPLVDSAPAAAALPAVEPRPYTVSSDILQAASRDLMASLQVTEEEMHREGAVSAPEHKTKTHGGSPVGRRHRTHNSHRSQTADAQCSRPPTPPLAAAVDTVENSRETSPLMCDSEVMRVSSSLQSSPPLSELPGQEVVQAEAAENHLTDQSHESPPSLEAEISAIALPIMVQVPLVPCVVPDISPAEPPPPPSSPHELPAAALEIGVSSSTWNRLLTPPAVPETALPSANEPESTTTATAVELPVPSSPMRGGRSKPRMHQGSRDDDGATSPARLSASSRGSADSLLSLGTELLPVRRGTELLPVRRDPEHRTEEVYENQRRLLLSHHYSSSNVGFFFVYLRNLFLADGGTFPYLIALSC